MFSIRQQSSASAIAPAKVVTATCHNQKPAETTEGRSSKIVTRLWSSGDVDALCKDGRLKEAIQILESMTRRGGRVYSNVFRSLLQECARLKALEEGRRVHAQITKSGINPNRYLENTLLSMYAKCGSPADARKVFNGITERNVVTWTAMIEALVASESGQKSEAYDCYQMMKQEGCKPDKVTFVTLLNAFSSSESLEQAQQVHEDIVEAGLELEPRVGTSLVGMYAKCGDVGKAREIFDRLSGKNVITWTVLIAGYAQQGDVKVAYELLNKMQQEGIIPNKVTYVSALKGCVSPVDLEQGKMIHASITQAEYNNDLWVVNALISMYCKCGSLEDAKKLFDDFPCRDVVTWTAMITGYTQQGFNKEAIDLFQRMQQEGMKADRVTFTSVLSACSSPAFLEKGKELHHDIVHARYSLDVRLQSALVSMYAKCGSMEDARREFDQMRVRNVVSWTAMITGNLFVALLIFQSSSSIVRVIVRIFIKCVYSALNPKP